MANSGLKLVPYFQIRNHLYIGAIDYGPGMGRKLYSFGGILADAHVVEEGFALIEIVGNVLSSPAPQGSGYWLVERSLLPASIRGALDHRFVLIKDVEVLKDNIPEIVAALAALKKHLAEMVPPKKSG